MADRDSSKPGSSNTGSVPASRDSVAKTGSSPGPRDAAAKTGSGPGPKNAAADKGGTASSRRQWERSVFTIKATLTLSNREFPPLTGVTEDVSLNGVKFLPARAIPPIPIGLEGSLVVALGDGPMTFPCRTVRVTNTHIFLTLLGKEAIFGQAITVEAFRSIKRPGSDQK
ncbi:MAG: PilZ domain-containing protein [Magnetococcus sp. DMHC-1]